MKRIAVMFVSVLLAFLIVATLLAIWMPAIYRSPWFKHTFPRL